METNPTTKEETFEFLKQLLVEDYFSDPQDVTPDATFEDDLAFDSLEVVEVWVSIEKKLLINMDDDRVKNCLTVGALSDEIFTCLQKQLAISHT